MDSYYESLIGDADPDLLFQYIYIYVCECVFKIIKNRHKYTK